MIHDDVIPELHGSPTPLHQIVDLEQEVQIHSAYASLLTGSISLALTQIESLITTDVELATGEVGEQFIVELAQQFERPWL